MELVLWRRGSGLGLGYGRTEVSSAPNGERSSLGKGHRRSLREDHSAEAAVKSASLLPGTQGGCVCPPAPPFFSLTPRFPHLSFHIVFSWVCPSPTVSTGQLFSSSLQTYRPVVLDGLTGRRLPLLYHACLCLVRVVTTSTAETS